MGTTIQVSKELVHKLKERKLYEKESYEEVIWDALEDSLELSKETKLALARAENDIAAGRTVTLAAVKKELDL